MALALEDNFLQACKNGNMMLLLLAIQQKVNINCHSGHGLRRAIRYNQRTVWQFLLSRPEIDVNLKNSHGQTALHTAARFNVPQAAMDLLQRKDVLVNSRSQLGCSPIIVAAKYASNETLKVLLQDSRMNLDMADRNNKKIAQLVGVALSHCDPQILHKTLLLIHEHASSKELKTSELNLDEGYLTMSSIVIPAL